MDRIRIRRGREGKYRVVMKATCIRHTARIGGGIQREGPRGALFGPCLFGLMLTAAATACGSDNSPAPDQIDEPFSVQGAVYPEWRQAPSPEPVLSDSVADSEPKLLSIYLDLSRPMAGYLPLDASSPQREGSGSANEFRAVAQWVPDHLTRVYSTASLQWRGVGNDIRPLSEYPRLDRSLFDATASRLDMAIREALVDPEIRPIRGSCDCLGPAGDRRTHRRPGSLQIPLGLVGFRGCAWERIPFGTSGCKGELLGCHRIVVPIPEWSRVLVQ